MGKGVDLSKIQKYFMKCFIMLLDKKVKKFLLKLKFGYEMLIVKKNWFFVIFDVKKYEFYNWNVVVFKVRVVVLKSGIFVELL